MHNYTSWRFPAALGIPPLNINGMLVKPSEFQILNSWIDRNSRLAFEQATHILQ